MSFFQSLSSISNHQRSSAVPALAQIVEILFSTDEQWWVRTSPPRRPLCSVPSHLPPCSVPMAPCPQASHHQWVQRMQEWTDALFSISLMRAGTTNKTGWTTHRGRKLCQRESDMQTVVDTVSPQAMGIPEKMPLMVATTLEWCVLSLCADQHLHRFDGSSGFKLPQVMFQTPKWSET